MMQGVIVDTAGQAHTNFALVALLVLLSPYCQNNNAYMQNGIYMIWSANWFMMLRGLFLVNWYGAVMVAFGSLEGGVGMDLLAATVVEEAMLFGSMEMDVVEDSFHNYHLSTVTESEEAKACWL
ncbi:hypothetical protein ACSQ67_006121 [Phaseolus vulgaris]